MATAVALLLLFLFHPADMLVDGALLFLFTGLTLALAGPLTAARRHDDRAAAAWLLLPALLFTTLAPIGAPTSSPPTSRRTR